MNSEHQDREEMLDLAKHIVETKKGHFQPDKFEDRYEDALKELIARKAKGEKIEAPKREKPSNVVNLMDALKRSLVAEGSKTAAAKKTDRRPRKAAAHSQRRASNKRARKAS